MKLGESPFRLQASSRRSQGLGEDALIPLINVVFLLLIFFMLAGQLETPDILSVEPPRSARVDSAEPLHLLLLLASDGRIAVDGEILQAEDLPLWLQAHLKVAQKPSITLKADAQVSARQLRHLLHILRQAGIPNITLLTDRS